MKLKSLKTKNLWKVGFAFNKVFDQKLEAKRSITGRLYFHTTFPKRESRYDVEYIVEFKEFGGEFYLVSHSLTHIHDEYLSEINNPVCFPDWMSIKEYFESNLRILDKNEILYRTSKKL